MIQENKNNGVVPIPSEKDWVAGANSQLQYQVNIPSGDWTPHLPENERQSDSQFDTLACVSFALVHAIETQLNFLLATSALPQTHVDFLKSNGYLNANGKVDFSERYIAKLSNTDQTKGNWPPRVADAINQYGLIPQSAWDFAPDMTWDEFYTAVPQNLIAKGQEFLKYFDFNFEWVYQNPPANVDDPTLEYHLKQAPLCITTAVCTGWSTDTPVKACGPGTQHETLLFKLGRFIFDHYNPFVKQLQDPDYTISYVFKIVPVVIPQPDPQPAPVQPTPEQKQQITSLLDQLLQLLAIIKARFITKVGNVPNTMNKLFLSSDGSGNVGTTFQGLSLLGIADAISTVLGYLGHPVSSDTISAAITGVIAAAGAIITAYGLLKKAYFAFRSPASTQ